MHCTNCGVCCTETEMLLSKGDIKRLEKRGFSQREFARFDRQGYVQLKKFPWQALLPENSPTLQVLVDGIAGESLERQARLRSKEGNGEGSLFLTEDNA